MLWQRTKSVYFCQSCGYESPKWLGKCPACGEWNTFVEERGQSGRSQTRSHRVQEWHSR